MAVPHGCCGAWFNCDGKIVGAIVLAMTGQSTPEVLVALGSAAIGGLAGLLAPSPLNR